MEVRTVKRIKQLAALCILAFPAAVFAAGTATGTVTHLLISGTFGDLILIELSGVKTGNPACSTDSPFQFLLPRNNTEQFYTDMLGILQSAYNKGGSVTITGLGACTVSTTLETINSVQTD
jgi:hypothetical protein